MLHNGVATIDHAGVVPALIEHAQIYTQLGRKINAAVQGAFVRRNDHQVILVHMQILYAVHQRLDHLISGHYVLKGAVGNGVLYTLIVGVKGHNVVHAQIDQLLQCQRAV